MLLFFTVVLVSTSSSFFCVVVVRPVLVTVWVNAPPVRSGKENPRFARLMPVPGTTVVVAGWAFLFMFRLYRFPVLICTLV